MISAGYPILAFLGNLGAPEIAIILVVALLIFGKRLPEVGRSLGRGIIEFKKGVKGIEEEIETEVDKAEANAKKPEPTVDVPDAEFTEETKESQEPKE